MPTVTLNILLVDDSPGYCMAASGMGALDYISKDAVVVELRPLLKRLLSGDQLDTAP